MKNTQNYKTTTNSYKRIQKQKQLSIQPRKRDRGLGVKFIYRYRPCMAMHNEAYHAGHLAQGMRYE